MPTSVVINVLSSRFNLNLHFVQYQNHRQEEDTYLTININLK